MRIIVIPFIFLALLCGSLYAQGTATDTTHSLTVTTNPYGKVHVASAATLSEAAALFGGFSGNLSLQYYGRTLNGGTITVQGTADFGTCSSPASSPSIACNTVHYTCGTASFGSACSSTITLATSSATTVVTLPSNSACTNGGSPCGPTNPFTIPLNFTLSNDPYYKTGPYSASLQFTFSAN